MCAYGQTPCPHHHHHPWRWADTSLWQGSTFRVTPRGQDQPRCQKGQRDGCNVGDTSSVVVARRTLSVMCRFLRESDLPPTLAPEPIQKTLRSIYILAGQRPGAPKWLAAATSLTMSSRSSPKTGSAAFFWSRLPTRTGLWRRSSRFSHRTVGGFNSVSWSINTRRRPASCCAQPGAGLVAPFSDVTKHMKSLGNLDAISTSPLTEKQQPSCSCVSQRRLLDEFLAFLRESGPTSRGRLAVRTWKSGDFFCEPLVSDSLSPASFYEGFE